MAPANHDSAVWADQLNSPVAYKSKAGGIADPPGFPSSGSGSNNKKQQKAIQPRKQPTPEEMDTLRLKKAWEVALAPAKSVPMTAFMMYMTGNSLQIFSIMTVFMAFKTPLMGLMGTNQAFERFESDSNRGSIGQVKAVYVLMQILALLVGLYKVNSMGLLPTTKSDWLAWEALREPLESAVAAL